MHLRMFRPASALPSEGFPASYIHVKPGYSPVTALLDTSDFLTYNQANRNSHTSRCSRFLLLLKCFLRVCTDRPGISPAHVRSAISAFFSSISHRQSAFLQGVVRPAPLWIALKLCFARSTFRMAHDFENVSHNRSLCCWACES